MGNRVCRAELRIGRALAAAGHTAQAGSSIRARRTRNRDVPEETGTGGPVAAPELAFTERRPSFPCHGVIGSRTSSVRAGVISVWRCLDGGAIRMAAGDVAGERTGARSGWNPP